MNLFTGSVDTWDERQTINHVPVHIETREALVTAADVGGADGAAERQYFSNPASDVRIVVFGHTHAAKIISGESHAGLKTIYVNSGTWIDHNPGDTTMNVVVITPQKQTPSSMTKVRLYTVADGGFTELAADELQF